MYSYESRIMKTGTIAVYENYSQGQPVHNYQLKYVPKLKVRFVRYLDNVRNFRLQIFLRKCVLAVIRMILGENHRYDGNLDRGKEKIFRLIRK